jgi:hypothetical protein
VHFAQTLIFGISATDPGTFGLVVAVLAAIHFWRAICLRAVPPASTRSKLFAFE